MDEPTLHVTFGESAAGNLVQAVKQAGRSDHVIAFWDCLSIGPIAYADVETRREWMEDVLGLAGFGDVIKRSERFWQTLLLDQRSKVIWVSRTDVMDYCGFLECLWRLGEAPCSIADLTEIEYVESRADGSTPLVTGARLATVSATTIVENNILDKVRPITQDERTRYHAAWERLRAENAAFRVLHDDGQIKSVAITHFDDLLIGCASSEWHIGTKIISEAMSKAGGVGDHVLTARLKKLVELGVLEGKGNLLRARDGEVRLPQTP